ncbi:helix-turn-helix transcriptional regulator [Streptomyces sp. NBC_00237]|uniref:XRE family transcriptional regulator n=1 Tax=Streptomyces sp. NBC_00237 TaxID=2975687 RepID=UPI00225521D7|nr:XRE family transcriptional regulator [Streptomyces sp. NBC_00237]MCX5201094.1 helix-turn-helix transcriptional regulator [Streptomyces sp. NBC_00237]
MAEQVQRTQLADLVRRRRAELGISLRTLSEAAFDRQTGEQAKFGWISKLENGKPTDAPSEPMLKALAAGLELPLRVLQEAAAAQYLGMGEVRSVNGRARLLIARIEEMGEDDLAQLSAIAETFANRGKG